MRLVAAKGMNLRGPKSVAVEAESRNISDSRLTGIEQGIRRFEPGTQGEHKVSRGFEPTLTWSAHFIADRRFRSAVDDYLAREGIAVDAYAAEVREHVPYREPRP